MDIGLNTTLVLRFLSLHFIMHGNKEIKSSVEPIVDIKIKRLELYKWKAGSGSICIQ